MLLVEGSSAVLGSAQAGDLLILDGELIIVRDLLIDADWLARIDDYFLSGFYGDDFRVAVRLNTNRRKYIIVLIKEFLKQCFYLFCFNQRINPHSRYSCG